MGSMKGRVNFGDLKKFRKKILKEFGDGNKVDCSEMMMDIVRTAGVRCLRRAQHHTPVDTGQLRGNWKAEQPVKRGWNYTVELKNDVEYASYIEFGHRFTKKSLTFLTKNHILDPTKPKKSEGGYYKPRFMLTKAIDETKEAMPDLVEEKIIKKFVELFP